MRQERAVESHGSNPISAEEVRLAARNHGMPLEALRYEITPVGLHYLLIHYDVPAVDPSTWSLEVDGVVERPARLSMNDLMQLPSVSLPATFECAGNGRALLDPRPVSQPWFDEAVGTGEWTGTPLRPLLEDAGLRPEAREVVFTGLDAGVEGGVRQSYQRALPVAEALGGDVMLAYRLNGGPLPPQHGFPLRLLVPGWYGMTNVKWLTRITVMDEPFTGYQNVEGYRFRQSEDEPGEPVTRMAPRSLMVPPGIPEFMTRSRHVDSGPSLIAGRAWSGRGGIALVEFSADGGRTWVPARLGEPPSPHAWYPWSITWEPPGAGTYELCCRATDSAGSRQPLDAPWNVGGYANNSVQRVTVTVDGP
jgi:DMSO/TMAO reductase YedYZ molybdopterin-dependent catalytic subunit